MNKTKTDGVALSLIASFCGATVPIFSKLILEYFSPSSTLFLRMLVSTILVSVLVLAIYKTKIIVNKQTLSIALFGSLNFVFFMLAINYMPAVISPIFYSLVPIEVTLFSFLFYRDRISITKIIGIFVGYAGAIIVLYPTFTGAKASEIEPLGILFILFASCSIAIYSILIQKSNKRYSPYNLSFQSITFALILSIPMLALSSSDFQSDKPFNYNVIWFLIGVAVIGTIGQYIVFQNAIAKIKASANVVFFYFQPFFVIVMLLILLNESIGIAYLFGLVFVLIGSSMNLGLHQKLIDLIKR